MAWPLSQDFNEAIQNPSSAFADAELKAGTVTTTPLGVPLPRSGNYADVYQIKGSNGKSWAVKCFTRPVAADLQTRYAAIAAHLAKANLPFTVNFEFLTDGIRVKGKPYPAVKMQWVEGFALNSFVKENLGRATILEAMLGIWVRLCRRLRETGMAHCDLQHGNVILVPGSDKQTLELKLVDYDGMFVPALAGKPTGEGGHASFQHPQRIATNAYSADLDRFPHLVVATALRGLLVGGKALWEKYDTGDNLLFTAKDFAAPAQSKVMRELWDSGDPFTVGLLAHLAISCTKPLAASPWLDQLMPEGRPPLLQPSQERQAQEILGLAATGTVPAVPPPPVADLGFEPGSRRSLAEPPKKANPKMLYGAIAAGVLAAVGIGVGIVAFGGKKNAGSGIVQNGSNGSASPGSGTQPQPVEPPPTHAQVEPANLKEGKVLWNEPGEFAAVMFSRDGSKLIATLPRTGEIRTFDAKSGKQIAAFKDHAPVGQVMAAPLPGGKVISCGNEPVLLVWDDKTGKVIGRVISRGPPGTVHAIQSDRAGKYVLVASGAKAGVIDLDDSKEILSFDLINDAQSGKVAAMLANDGSGVLALVPGNKMKWSSLPAGSTVEVALTVPGVERIAASHPGEHLAALVAGTPEKPDIIVVDITNGQKLCAIAGTNGRCGFTPDGKHLVAAGPTGVRFYNPRTGEPLGRVPFKNEVNTVDFAVSPNGGTAAVATAKNSLILAENPFGASPGYDTVPVVIVGPNVENLAPVLTLKDSEVGNKPVIAAATDKDAKQLFLSDGERIRGLDVATKTETFNISVTGKVARLWKTDAGLIAELHKPGNVVDLHFYDETGKQTKVVEGLQARNEVQSVSVNAAGTHAAVVRKNGNVSVYDFATGQALATINPWGKDGPKDAVAQLFLPSPADRVFVNRPDQLQIRLFSDLNKARSVAPGGNSNVLDDITDDGRLVAIHQANEFFLKKPDNWKEKGPRIAAGAKTQFRFLGNGRRGAIIDDGRIRICDTESGKELGSVASNHPSAANQASVNVGRTALVIYGGPFVTVLSGSAGTAVVAQPPVSVDPPRKARKPVPADADVQTAAAKVRELFKEQYAKKQSADRRKLAEALQKIAENTKNDDVGRYFMLREVRALAEEMQEPALGIKAIVLLDADFEIDGTAERIDLHEKIGAAVLKLDLVKAFVESCSEQAEELAEKSEFDAAMKLVGLGLAAATKSNLTTPMKEFDQRQTQLRRQRELFGPVKNALVELKQSADNPAANLIVGKYRCFVQGRWSEGLLNLATGSDEALKKAAQLDLNVSEEAIKKADAWWTWAQTQPPLEKTAAEGRAKVHYASLLPTATGLDKKLAEDRLSFKHDGVEYRPGLLREVITLNTNPKVKGPSARALTLVRTADIDSRDYRSLPDTFVGVKFIGHIVPPAPGRYKIVLDGKSKTFVKFFARPEDKMLINILDPDVKNIQEAFVTLPSGKPVAVYLESVLTLKGRGSTPPNSISLRWLKPGAEREEAIPADVWFHPKASESSLTEK